MGQFTIWSGRNQAADSDAAMSPGQSNLAAQSENARKSGETNGVQAVFCCSICAILPGFIASVKEFC
jgi:hypothetical protein